ncbi:MAG: efflux RND transporter periplasmic adaptor subunit [Nitrospiraceae bacterium]|nr:efflux RND transporter periplasmic adaptor subunit [Nitrospiraceae bacterium]
MKHKRGWGVPVMVAMALAACSAPDTPVPPKANAPAPQPAASKPDLRTLVVGTDVPASPLTLSARLTYAEDGFSRVSSPLQGPVLDVRVKLGQAVKAGDVLAVIDAADIATAYAAYVEEISELGLAERNFELAQDLLKAQAMPLKEFKQAENDLNRERAEFKQAKERLLSLRVPAGELSKPLDQQQITSRFELRSPLTGTVVDRTVTPGQIVGPGTDAPLFTIADLSRLQVVADVYERDLAGIQVGHVAVMTVEAYPGMEFPSIIRVIGDVVDPSTRTIKIRALVSNGDRRLKPDMFAKLILPPRKGVSRITLPKEAVLQRDGKYWVVLETGQGQREEREVQLEASTQEQVVVKEGLTPGERVLRAPASLSQVPIGSSRQDGA